MNKLQAKIVFLTKYALPLFLILLYLPQSLLVWHFFDDTTARLLFLIVLLTLSGYYIGFCAVNNIWKDRLRTARPPYSLSLLLFGLFIVCGCWLLATGPKPLLVALQGADANTIIAAREGFIKTRTGFDVIFVYLFVLLSRSAAPLAVVTMFGTSSRWRFLSIFLSLSLLLVSMEKFISALILLPLAVFYWLQNKKLHAISVLLSLVLFIGCSTMLSRVGTQLADISTPIYTESHKVASTFDMLLENISISDGMKGPRNIFRQKNTINFMVNRIIWIPFITAYDWLAYWQSHYHHYLKGQNNRLIASITGKNKINMEREVFGYQFLGNATSTGSANTFFSVDAYVNFGFVGVFVYSVLIGAFFSVVLGSQSLELISVSILYAYSLSISSLLPNLLSGGIFLFLFIWILSLYAGRKNGLT